MTQHDSAKYNLETNRQISVEAHEEDERNAYQVRLYVALTSRCRYRSIDKFALLNIEIICGLTLFYGGN